MAKRSDKTVAAAAAVVAIVAAGPPAEQDNKYPGAERLRWSPTAYLERYREHCDQVRAAQELGISWSAAYQFKKKCQEFAADFQEVVDEWTHGVEASTMQRCRYGELRQDIRCTEEHSTKDTVTRTFEVVGEHRVWPDKLITFMLKSRAPQIYSETAIRNRAIASMEPDEDIQRVHAAFQIRRFSKDERDALKTVLEAQRRVADEDRDAEYAEKKAAKEAAAEYKHEVAKVE